MCLILRLNYRSKFYENVKILYLLLGKGALNFIEIHITHGSHGSVARQKHEMAWCPQLP